MKKLRILLMTLIIVSACFWVCLSPVFAENAVKANGEVLYHQDFSAISDFQRSGIVNGTLSSQNSYCSCADGALEINTYDNDRVYTLLPHTDVGDTYTVEFDFAFTAINADNGFIAFILTCRGAEPTNITSLVIRANGTVDNFETPPEELSESISDGGRIHVKIPIENGALHKIELTANGGATYTLDRDNVVVIDEGEMGFTVRNASVRIPEIYIVNGVDYEEMSGYYLAESYASDDSCEYAQPDDPDSAADDCSPNTGDEIFLCAVAFAAVCGGVFLVFSKNKLRT